MDEVYHKLTVVATHPDTEIWVGDEIGWFVCKGVGLLEERLKPGDYVVSFGLKGTKYRFCLDRSLTLTQTQLRKERQTRKQ